MRLRTLPALALLLLPAGCQLRYQVSLCTNPADQQTMIEVMVDRPGDARVSRIAIYDGAAPPSREDGVPLWVAETPDQRNIVIHRVGFGRPIPGFQTRGEVTFDPGRGYWIRVDGAWHGALAFSPHTSSIGLCR